MRDRMLFRSLVSITLLSLVLLVGCGDGLSGSATGRNVSDMEALQEKLSEFAENLAQFNEYHSDFEAMAYESLVLADETVDWIDELIDTASPESALTPDELREIRGRITSRDISDLHPRWSPDGQRIIFTSNINGDYDLYSLNADGSDFLGRGPATRLEREDNTDGDFSPDWSQYPVSTTPASSVFALPSADSLVEPSSTVGSIAFTSDRDGNDEIYVMSPDGTDQTRLTYNPGLDGNPSWSPDGTKIAFTSERDGTEDIYIMNSDGSDQTRLTDPTWVEEMGHWRSYRPAWSPDGSTIAFTIGPDWNRWTAVAFITADGSDPTLFTDGDMWCNNSYCSSWAPFWAPDGTPVFYGTSREPPPCQLINCDDGFVDPGRAVYELSGFDSVEEWSPSIWGDEIDSFEEPCVSLAYGIDVLNTCAWSGYWHEADGEWPQIAWSANGLLAYVDTTECTQWAVDNDECRSSVQDSLLVVASSDYTDPWSSVALGSEDGSPSFSPDGTQMVFVSERDENEEIYVWNADGSGQNRLTNNSDSDKDPSWGPTTASAPVETAEPLATVGTRIVYASREPGYYSDIYVMDADGSDRTKIVDSPQLDGAPSWSPDGSKIAFVSGRDFAAHGNEIYTVDSDGTGVERLTEAPGFSLDPSWSPDGSKIVFKSNRNDNTYEIYITDADGSNVTRLTFDNNYPEDPSWSQDGTKIAFSQIVSTSQGGSNRNIYVMDADGSNLVRLTDSLEGDSGPSWSPDGSKIAFHSLRDRESSSSSDSNYEIYVMDADGSNQTRLTEGGERATGNPSWDQYPSWSTDGTKIVFTSNRGRTNELYVMDADGSNLTGYPGRPRDSSESSPDWGPAPAPAAIPAESIFTLGTIASPSAGGAVTGGGTYAPGTTVTVDAVPIAGYGLASWSGACSGTGACTVTMDADKEVTANFTIESSGESIVFHSDRGGDYEIYAVNANGSGIAVPLTDNAAWDGDARRSPDGTKIVFTSNRHDDGLDGTDIYVMNSNGTGQERLTFTYSGRSSADPSWSPDSQRIVFSSQLGGTDCSADEIYVMDADGSNQTPLTDNEDDYECDDGYPDYWDRNPSWSPDGTQIIFAATRGGNPGIYVMNADGTGQTQLTTVNFNDHISILTPSWSPDGTEIAFSSARNNAADIYVMDADGTEPFALTYDNGLKEAIQDLKVARDVVMGEVLESIKSDIEYLMTQSDEEPDLSLQRTTAERFQELFGLLDIQKAELAGLYDDLLGIREDMGTWPSQDGSTRRPSCEGKEIKFKIGNVWANETVVWAEGAGELLNLTASTASLPSNDIISLPVSPTFVMPHVVVGSVGASDGTPISAWYRVTPLATTNASEGSYQLVIRGDLCSIDTPNPVPTPVPTPTPTPTPNGTNPPIPSIESRTINMGQKETGIFEGHPFLTSSPRIQFVSSSVGEGLITITPDLSASPMLAESWEISDDFSEWTWHLREGVEFHKGYGEMTTQDVLYSYQQWHLGRLHSRSGRIGEYFSVEGADLREGADIRIIDDHTFQVNTGTPWVPHDVFEFMKNGGWNSTWVVSERQSEDLGIEVASKDIAATGPWQIEEHSSGAYWKMSAVEDHWRQTPYFDELIYWTIPDEARRVTAFQVGQLDSFDMAFDSISAVEAVEGATVVGWPNAGQAGLNFYGQTYGLDKDGNEYEFYDPAQPWVSSDMDPESQAWKDAVHVRKAMNIAIDRQSIVDIALSGFGNSQSIRDWMGHEARANPDWVYPYDPELARSMLAEVGYPDGFTITLITAIRGAPRELDACDMVRQYWEAIGIDVNMQFLPYGTIRPDLITRRYQGVTCHTVGIRLSPIIGASNYTTDSIFSYGTHHPWLDEHIRDTQQQVQRSRIEAGELEIYNWMFDNAVTASIYTHDGIWPIGPRLDPDWLPTDYSEIRTATAFEYARPR